MRQADDDDEVLNLPGELKPKAEPSKRIRRMGPRSRTRRKRVNSDE